jgi:GWxTD domain-containing protein
MRRLACLFVVVVLLTMPAFAGDPGAAIGRGRQALNERHFDDAIQILQSAIPDAVSLQEPQHSQALAAIHFFSALAFYGLSDESKTREELQQFFQFNPKASALDPARYDPGFVRMFNNIAKEPRTMAETGGSSSNFDEVYPGYATYREHDPRVLTVEQWGDGPDLQLLGSQDEKRLWRRLADDGARRNFVDNFWKQRDTTPETEENEFRREFMRRVSFADETFRTPKSRGSLTDRGRVFVLLGPPRLVRQKPLTAKDGAFNRVGAAAATRNINTSGPNMPTGSRREVLVEDANLGMALSEPNLGAPGTVERWVFAREQLPRTIPDAEVTFKFISQEGYGDHVLQRELLVNKVLVDAGTGK